MRTRQDIFSTNIIFDFDGTLANTLYKIVEIINRDPARYKIDGVSPIEIERLRNLSISYLLKEFNVHTFRVPTFLKQLQRDLNKEIATIAFFDGIPEVLNQLNSKGYNLGVLTGNSVKNVNDFLLIHEVNVFNFVKSERSLFGKHKSLNKIMKTMSMDPSKTYYVGDEVRDIEAAKKSNIHSVAVTWGYNSEELLKRHEPDYLVHTPKSILEIFEV